jgi:hypothetical protein
MKHLAVLIMALLIPAAAIAKGECQEDVQKFCKDIGKARGCCDCLPSTAHG